MNWIQFIRNKLLETKGFKSLTIDTLNKDVQLEIAKQFADAETKRDARWHWGNVGDIVWQAANDSARVLTVLPKETPDEYFLRVLPEMALLADSYRKNSIDRDGYGLGTVRELEEMIKAKANAESVFNTKSNKSVLP